MFIPGLDNNGVLAPGVDGFKNLVEDLATKNSIVNVKQVLDRALENKTTFDLKTSKTDLVNPVENIVNDFGLNFNKQINVNNTVVNNFITLLI